MDPQSLTDDISALSCSLHERLSRFVLSLAGNTPPSRVLHYHLQENYFSNEESRPINPHGLTFLRRPSLAEQLVKIPFKKFIVQFPQIPPSKHNYGTFISIDLCPGRRGGVELGVGWGRGSGWRVGSGKSLFLKGKVYGLLSISVHACCAGDREAYE